jgi:hypothetical protein
MTDLSAIGEEWLDGAVPIAVWNAYIDVQDEAIKWHSMELAPRGGGGVPPSLDEWVKSGKPETWSPIIDTVLKGYEAAAAAGDAERYFKEWLVRLRGVREARLAKREAV